MGDVNLPSRKSNMATDCYL